MCWGMCWLRSPPAIAEERTQRSQRSYGNTTATIAAIAAIAIAGMELWFISAIVAIETFIWKPLSNDRSDQNIFQNALQLAPQLDAILKDRNRNRA